MKSKLAFTAAAAALAMATAAAPVEAREMYVRGTLGAAGSWAGDATTESFYISQTLSTRSVSAISLGRGIGANAAVGVQLADHLYGEIALGYHGGLPFESRTTISSSASTYTKTSTLQGEMFRMTPSLMFTANLASLKPFARLGMVVALPKVTASNDSTENNVREVRQIEFSGGPTLGFTGALGVEIALGASIALTAEANYLSMAFAPTAGKLVKATDNGVDKLPAMTTREKEVQYVDNLTENPSQAPLEGSPDVDTTITIPFSNFGAAVSLVYKF